MRRWRYSGWDSLTASIIWRSSTVNSYELGRSSFVLFLSLALLPPVVTRSRHPHSPQYLAHRSPLPPMGFDQSQHRLLLTRHQPPALSQSKFISFFNSLIKSAWFSTTSLSFRFSASKRLRSAVFNGRLLRNDARTPTSNCRFHF